MVLPLQESIDNGLSHFDYNSYNNYDDKFDPYLDYGERYDNRRTFEITFYE